MARHVRSHSTQESQRSLLCRSVHNDRPSRDRSADDVDRDTNASVGSADDLDSLLDYDVGEERFGGLSYNRYSAACNAAVAVLRSAYPVYDVVNLVNFLSTHCPSIPRAARVYLAIGAACGAMHAVIVSAFAQKLKKSTDPVEIAILREKGTLWQHGVWGSLCVHAKPTLLRS